MTTSRRQNPQLSPAQWLITSAGSSLAACFGGLLCSGVASGYRNALLNAGFSSLDGNTLCRLVQGHSLTIVSTGEPVFGTAAAFGMTVFGGLMLTFGSIPGESKADHTLRTFCGWLPLLAFSVFVMIVILPPPARIFIDLDHSKIIGGRLPHGTDLKISDVASFGSYFANKEDMIGAYTKHGQRIDLIAVSNADEAASAATAINAFVDARGTNQ